MGQYIQFKLDDKIFQSKGYSIKADIEPAREVCLADEDPLSEIKV